VTCSDVRWIDDVLRFWFDELAPRDWWSGAAAVDDAIRTRFSGLREILVRDPPAADDLDARGHLAAVIVYDQFSRNLFRGAAEAFAADAFALSMTLDAIARALDREVHGAHLQFLYMPLMHSESPAMQARSIEQFALLPDPRAARSARQHADTIARFGRFPYRNAALGRESTDEERAFLKKHPGPE
jgi:uncharacterized protein (DUF924 family)